MKFMLVGLFCLLLAGYSQQKESPQPIRVMTYNIKYDNKGDSVQSWNARKQQVLNLISFYHPDFVGTQEALYNQVKDLDALPHFDHVGAGRQDGKKKGEFSALFYNTQRFQLVEGTDSTMWLSETPGTPGKAWGAGYPRILSWGKFRDKQNGRTLWAFNTHLDNVSAKARANSARLIRKTIKKIADNKPVILTGDFNSMPGDKPHAILTAKGGLRDSYALTDSTHIGPDFSYSGFKVDPSAKPHRIDYIYINEGFKPLQSGIISDFRGTHYPSDHLPVITDLAWK